MTIAWLEGQEGNIDAKIQHRGCVWVATGYNIEQK